MSIPVESHKPTVNCSVTASFTSHVAPSLSRRASLKSPTQGRPQFLTFAVPGADGGAGCAGSQAGFGPEKPEEVLDVLGTGDQAHAPSGNWHST